MYLLKIRKLQYILKYVWHSTCKFFRNICIEYVCTDEYRCDATSAQCIPRTWLCDGEADCSGVQGQQDEANCSKTFS